LGARHAACAVGLDHRLVDARLQRHVFSSEQALGRHQRDRVGRQLDRAVDRHNHRDEILVSPRVRVQFQTLNRTDLDAVDLDIGAVLDAVDAASGVLFRLDRAA